MPDEDVLVSDPYVINDTTFVVNDGVVTVTRSDQPECKVPVADIFGFCKERQARFAAALGFPQELEEVGY